MRVEKFECDKDINLNKFLCSKNISYNLVCKVIRAKDVKVNGKRIGQDIKLCAGDEVVVYLKDEQKFNIIFEDENIVVVFKPRCIETVSDLGEDLLSKLKQQLNQNLFAVHRLDRNTEGLVVFAKNEYAKISLDKAFKNRTIEKFYLALVFGEIKKQEDTLVAYLKKDEQNSLVKISDNSQNGYEKIITKYKVLKVPENLSLVEVELVTGKTHQIRAHLSHIGHFVIGDEKYGDSRVNKKYKKHYQELCAYKIIFHFEDNDYLSYLNNKEIKLDFKQIDFCQNL